MFSGHGSIMDLVWSDEFNNSTIDPTNWRYETGGNGWGINELEYYTSRLENVKTENRQSPYYSKKRIYR